MNNIKKTAIGFAIFSATVTSIAALTGWMGCTLWNLTDVLLISGCAYGLYKNNLWSTLLLSVYWTYCFLTISVHGQVSGIIVSLAMLISFWRAFIEIHKDKYKLITSDLTNATRDN